MLITDSRPCFNQKPAPKASASTEGETVSLPRDTFQTRTAEDDAAARRYINTSPVGTAIGLGAAVFDGLFTDDTPLIKHFAFTAAGAVLGPILGGALLGGFNGVASGLLAGAGSGLVVDIGRDFIPDLWSR